MNMNMIFVLHTKSPKYISILKLSSLIESLFLLRIIPMSDITLSESFAMRLIQGHTKAIRQKHNGLIFQVYEFLQ